VCGSQDYVADPVKRRRVSVRVRGAAEMLGQSTASTAASTQSVPPQVDQATSKSPAPHNGSTSAVQTSGSEGAAGPADQQSDTAEGGVERSDLPNGANGVAEDETGAERVSESRSSDGRDGSGPVGSAASQENGSGPAGGGAEDGKSPVGLGQVGGDGGQATTATGAKGSDGQAAKGAGSPFVVTDVWAFKSQLAVFPSCR
jgi:hypothetical protein